VVNEVDVQVGQSLQPNAPVAVIIEDQVPTLEVDIDQKDLPYLKNGLPAAVKFDAYPERVVQAQVAYVCSGINTDKGTCRVRLVITEPQPFIRFGMTGTADILAATYTNVPAVPSGFVLREQPGNAVWRWNGRGVQRTAVTGRPVGERWFIADNLPAGSLLLMPRKGVAPERARPGKQVDVPQ
jgi:multidrug efflux pump subunit AcrA (membrane-fusion protein)